MKKKIVVLSFLLSICFSFVNAQNLNPSWVNKIGSTNNESIKKIVVDSVGNVYIAGIFRDGVDFDPSESTSFLQSHGENDVFFGKFSSDGELIWINNIGGSQDDEINDIVVLKNGNVLIGGVFANDAEFDPSGKNSTILSVASGKTDGYFAQYSSNGELIWAKGIGGSVISLGVDKVGNIFTSGIFFDIENFDPDSNAALLTSNGENDVYFAKYNSSGTYIWHFGLGSTNNDFLGKMTLDLEGNIFLTGKITGKTDFNPGLSDVIIDPKNSNEGFIAKYNGNTGNYEWVKSFTTQSGNTVCQFNSIIIENKKSGNIFCAGNFSEKIDFNPATSVENSLTSKGGNDVFLLKLNFKGEYIWAKSFGSSEDDNCNSLTIDSLSNIYITGSYYENIDIDFSSSSYVLTSNGKKDIYLAKYDSNSGFVWAQSFGSVTDDEGASIAPYNKNIVLVGGQFEDVINLGTINKIASEGEKDFFFAKYSTCNKIEKTEEILSCKTVTVQGQTFSTSGVISKTFPIANGCDSVYTINVKIEKIATNLKTSACDSFIYNKKTYTKTGNYSEVFKTKDGCDSSFTLFLTINKAQKGELIKKACQSFSLNGQTYTKTGTYSQSLKTKKGCDSLLTINLTISNSVEATFEKTACDSYTLNGQTYNTSGNYTQQLKTPNGCDSTLTLKLTINKSSTTTLDKTACDSYVFNGQTYTKSGAYTAKLSSTKGCDSTVILNLVINSVKATATINQKALIASPAGATYQWLDCAKNKAPIANATQQTFAPTVNGTYAVSVTQNGCSSVSDCINLIIIATNDKDFSNSISIFPNPSNGKYMLKSNNISGNADIKVLDINGRQLIKKDNTDINNLTIDISDYQNGIYLLNIISDKKEATFKLIKQ